MEAEEIIIVLIFFIFIFLLFTDDDIVASLETMLAKVTRSLAEAEAKAAQRQYELPTKDVSVARDSVAIERILKRVLSSILT